MHLPKINHEALISNLKQASPTLMIIVGTLGLVGGTVYMYFAAVKANKEVEKAKEEKAEKEETAVEETHLDVKEVVEATWKTMAPVIALDMVSIGCLIGGCSVEHKRMEALSTIATMSASTFEAYQKSVVETIGEKKEKEVRANMARKEVNEKFEAMTSDDDIIVTGRGNQLFFDSTCNTLFYSDRDFIGKQICKLNRIKDNDMYVTLTEWYDLIGLPHTTVSDLLAWCADDGYIEPDYEAIFTKDGRTCTEIQFFPKGPTADFMNKFRYA